MNWFNWSRRLPWFLLGLGAVLLILGGWIAQQSLDDHYLQGQARTTARLVATTSIPRVMHAPGVEAWLRDKLEEAVHDLPSEQKLAYSRIVDRGEAPDLPWFGQEFASLFANLEELLHVEEYGLKPVEIEESSKNRELVFRTVGKLNPDQLNVVSRRRSLGNEPYRRDSDAFIRFSSVILDSLAESHEEMDSLCERKRQVEQELEPVRWFSALRLIRFYTISEDGTFVSRPMDEKNLNRVDDEVAECRARPHSPIFANSDFIFDLDYSSEEGSLPRYSGIYLDIAGGGVIGTLVRPIVEPSSQMKGVLAADIAFDIDFKILLQDNHGATEFAIASEMGVSSEESWQPWSALRGGLGPEASTELSNIVQYLAERETRHDPNVARRPVYHHVMAETGETIFAIQIARTRWLVARVPGKVLFSPWFTVLLVPLLFFGLVVAMEWQRRSARRAVNMVRGDLSRWHDFLRSQSLPTHPEEVGPHLDKQFENARQDERDRLAAILNHGVDTLARILSSELKTSDGRSVIGDQVAVCREFCGWLSQYLVRRIHVTQWTLENWGSGPKHNVLSSLEASQAGATVAVYSNICYLVRARPGLRARLHWNNGILSTPPKDSSGTSIVLKLDWPSDWLIGLPEEGVFGFVLGELLVNAIKYGAPGSVIEVTAQFNPTRKEVMLCVANDLAQVDESARPQGRRYGGLAIVHELANLCGWHDFKADSMEGRFRVTWSCATVKRRHHDAAD